MGAELTLGRVVAEPVEQQADQVSEGQARMVELADADADHTEFTEAIEAEAADDVMDVVGRKDTVVDIIGVSFQVVVERRLGEEIDVVSQRIQDRHVGVTERAAR